VAVAIAAFALLCPGDGVPGDSGVRDDVSSVRFVINFESVPVFCDCDRLGTASGASMSATLTLSFTLISRLATATTLVTINRHVPGTDEV
jgi:hypothetical protein